ncbi:MAG: precorrin-2 C(20)-methyltransferase [Clostridium sp.]|nr:precorrin-2 C(20)-methyltransferase [Clostridium sp.]MDU7082507.1 precorrin-2 C(20)-methyltransferase [Clostridium sp.]
MKGILYGVGVGPGDKKFLTLAAVDTLRKADIIAVPDTGGEKTAMNIVAEFIEGKEILYCDMPMTRDAERLKAGHNSSADAIIKRLDEGLNVAFITLGDPCVYSTYMYVHRIVLAKGYDAEIISGVTSFCAAAAALNISLCDGADALHIIPASYEGTDELLKLQGNKVLMKSGKSLGKVKNSLRELGYDNSSQMVECCAMANEKTYKSLSEIPDESSYFSIIIVKGDEK